jgi:PASTA domain
VDNNRCITDEEFAKQVTDVPATADRVRLVALDHTSMLGSAKERSLRRELAIKTEQLGQDADQVKALAERLSLHQVLRTQMQAEIQRSQTVAPQPQTGAFILHGRVVDSQHLSQPGLTVSAVDGSGRAVAFVCTDDRGYFKLEITVKDPAGQSVFLQVSDKNGAVLYRGTEAYSVVSQGIVYREIMLGGQQPEQPCPPPPAPEPQPTPEPQPETVKVPDVTNQPEAKATELLKAAKLSVGERTTRQAPNQVGLVLAQDPKAGSEVAVGTAVALVIGVDKQVTVPKLVGLKVETARRTLKKAGLTVGTVKERTSDKAGVVLEQDAAAEKEVPLGTPVHLVVGRVKGRGTE